MCYPCRCPRRSISCHGGSVCCPRPCCRERSRSMCSPRVIFPGEFQKFSDMIPPSFLLKQPPKCEKVQKKPNTASKAAKRKKEPDNCDKVNDDDLCGPQEPGVTGIPSQPTDAPWCGTNGPCEYPMSICMPPQPQWVCFECPAAICFPRDLTGLPAAGLPTKRSPPFNPCTGQVYQCEPRQMMVGNYNETAQCPTNNQFCQGVNICFNPANPCYQFNPPSFGDGANDPNRNQTYYQPYQDVNMEYGNVAKASKSKKGLNSSQRHQYIQHNYGEGANSYEANRDQPYSQFCQGLCMYPGPANAYYPYDGGDETFRPSPEDPRTVPPQGESRSKVEKKGKEKRGGNVGKATESRKGPIAGQRHQYNQENCVVGANKPNRDQIYMDSRRVPRQNPSSGHESQGGKRSTSQGTRSESREAYRSNQPNRSYSQNPRRESIDRRKDPQAKQSGRVTQQNPAAGKGVYQHGNRPRSQARGNQTIEAPRLNNQNQYSSHNSRKQPIDPGISPRANSFGKQVSQSTTRSKSLEPRNGTRRDNSARVPHPCKSRTISPDRALHGDGRSKSSGKRNDPREQRSKNKPESNLHLYQQNMGMSFGPSNQHNVADPIYTTQLESTMGNSGSRRERSESLRGTSTGKNGESRWESLPGDQQARGAPQCYNLRFNPNNQYRSDHMSGDCFCPPSQEDLRSPRQESYDLASIDRSQLLNRTNKSRSLDDRQMSTCRRISKKCTQTKSSKPKPTVADILANEISSQPHVLVLKTQKDEKKKKMEQSPGESKILEARDQSSYYTQDESSSFESLEDLATLTDNDEEKAQKKSKEKTKKKAQERAQNHSNDEEKAQRKSKEKTKKKAEERAQKEAQDECEELSNSDDAISSGCPNSCWMRCPIPCSCRYGICSSSCRGPCRGSCRVPCNGPSYYLGNCCNGCYQCCNYRCNPCVGYCCSPPPANQSGKAAMKSKEKQAGRNSTHKRNHGGTSAGHFMLPPPPIPGFPIPSPSTMPGYYPTGPPQFISPYSGHWQANEVVSNPMFSKQYP